MKGYATFQSGLCTPSPKPFKDLFYKKINDYSLLFKRLGNEDIYMY